MDRPQICRRAAQGNRPGSWFLFGNWIRDRSVFMPKNKKSVNNAEIWLVLLHFSSLCTKMWKRLYNAEMSCCQIFHRFAAKDGKVRTVLRSAALKFVAAPRKGPALDPGFLISNLIRDKSFFAPKSRKAYTVLRSSVAKFFMALHSKMEKYVQR